MRPPNERFQLDVGVLIGGVIVGLLIGALAALLFSPVSGEQMMRRLRGGTTETPTARKDSDPVAESIAEGKAAARRLRAQLGITPK
jgi:gas vesicle protein